MTSISTLSELITPPLELHSIYTQPKLLANSFASLNVTSLSWTKSNLLPTKIHYMLLFLVVPVSSFALIVGLNNHKNSFIFFIGLSGLAILVSALFIELPIKTISGEILLTIIGSLLITFSHYKNYKLCDHLECDCHE